MFKSSTKDKIEKSLDFTSFKKFPFKSFSCEGKRFSYEKGRI